MLKGQVIDSGITDAKVERECGILHKTKEESTNGKLKCHNVWQINVKAYVLIPVFDCWKTKTQLSGHSKGDNHAEQTLMLCMHVA